MTLRILLSLPNGDEKTVDLADVGLPCVVGRDSASAQIVIPDPQASRAHCSIDRHDQGLVIEDLGSLNGTFVNDQRITKAVITERDELRIGTTRFQLEPPPEAPDPLVGTRVGGFDLNEVMGRGRFGTVYRGTQVNLGRDVAVKVLSSEYRSDPARVKAFLDEARKAGRLNHPHLVQVHDVVSHGEDHLLIMELMSHSLGERLKDEGPLEEDDVFDVVRDVAKALAYAESQRIVHRDVKPDNILVNEEGSYKLADLGIAMGLGEDGRAHQDQVYGSPHYVAPEQARGQAIDGRADLYALGATAWHLLTGQPLFQGTAKQIVAMHIGTPIPDLRRLAPGVSPGMVELLARLLKKDPTQRPARAADVVEQVEGARRRAGAARSPVRKVSRVMLSRRSRLRRRH